MAGRPASAAAKGGRYVLAVLLAAVLFLALNLLGMTALSGVRADLTDRSLYTLSPGTVTILKSIPEPLTIRLYETRELVDSVPTIQTFAPEVLQLLRTFEQVAGGKLRFRIVDTQPFSAEEDAATGFGLSGFNISQSGERGYFGLVGTNSLDGLEVIDFLDPNRQPFLQYDLARMVYRLTRPTETTIAVMDGLAMYGSAQTGRQPAAVLSLMSEDYKLTDVSDLQSPIPDGTDVLMVTHPARLTPTQQYAIDQFALGGGRVLAFIDPLAERSPPDPTNPNRPQNPSSDLGPLMASWGIGMDTTKVVGDTDMALQTVGTAGNQRVVANYVPWLRIGPDSFPTDEPITSRLQAMRMSSAGAITKRPDATTTVTPLIETTPNSMLIDQSIVMRRVNPNALLDAFVPSGVRQWLAVKITGAAKTAFPDGPPKADPSDDVQQQLQQQLPGAAPPQLKESKGPIDVIVVADTDMLNDSHVIDQQGRVTTSNADFVFNAIGELAGGDALIGIRGGQQSSRPFTRVVAMEQQAQATYRTTQDKLTQQLSDIQQQLQQLQGPQAANGQPNNGIVLSQQQQAAVAQYNQQSADLRRQLRAVQQALRSDIDVLENLLKFLNIALVPILLIVATALVALWRSMRLRRHRRQYKLAEGRA